MKKESRTSIIRQLIKETGLTPCKRTDGYFSLVQLTEMLLFIRRMKSEIKTLTAGVFTNVRIERTSGR